MENNSNSRKRDRDKEAKPKSKKRNQTCNSDAEKNMYLENRYISLIPGPVLAKKREKLVKKVKNLIESGYQNSTVGVYGSYLSNTALISSDIDFVVYVNTDCAERAVDEIMEILVTGEFKAIEKRKANTHDRIGIFCYEEDENKVTTYMDLTINNKVAQEASELFRSLVEVNLKVKILIVLIKEFSKCFRINDCKRGTLASVGYTYMAVFALQVNHLLPKFVNRSAVSELSDIIAEADAFKVSFDEVCQQSGNSSTLQLLRTFFHYYNQVHNFSTDVVSIMGGRVVSKESLKWHGGEQRYTLAIVDPFGVQNVGRSVSFGGMKKIKKAFEAGENILHGSKPRDLFRHVDAE